MLQPGSEGRQGRWLPRCCWWCSAWPAGLGGPNTACSQNLWGPRGTAAFRQHVAHSRVTHTHLCTGRREGETRRPRPQAGGSPLPPHRHRHGEGCCFSPLLRAPPGWEGAGPQSGLHVILGGARHPEGAQELRARHSPRSRSFEGSLEGKVQARKDDEAARAEPQQAPGQPPASSLQPSARLPRLGPRSLPAVQPQGSPSGWTMAVPPTPSSPGAARGPRLLQPEACSPSAAPPRSPLAGPRPGHLPRLRAGASRRTEGLWHLRPSPPWRAVPGGAGCASPMPTPGLCLCLSTGWQLK